MEYINEYCWSDVKSYKLERTSDKKGIATPVKKILSKDTKVFNGEWRNAYDKCDNIVESGESFDVECRNGVWGFVTYKDAMFNSVKSIIGGKEAILNMVKDGITVVFNADESRFAFVELTKTGKPKTKFYKLGYASEFCDYKYDWDF